MNIQNIPSDPEFRKCFDSSKGRTLINADYSGKLITFFIYLL